VNSNDKVVNSNDNVLNSNDKVPRLLAELAARYKAEADVEQGLERLRAAGHGLSKENGPENIAAASTRSLRRLGKSGGRAWDWFNQQSPGIQALIALASFIVALATLVVAILPIYAAHHQARESSITLSATPNQLISSNGQGVPANGNSGRPALDRSGRFVVFTSVASNLADNAGGHYNIYVKDRVTGSVYLASRGANGAIPNGDSQFPTICPTGRWIAFASTATNLLDGLLLRQHLWRVYVHDTLSGTTQLVSVAVNGSDPGADSRNPEFSADCSRVVFESTATTLTVDQAVPRQWAVYVRDLRTHTTTLASIATDGSPLNGDSTHATISPDGNTVAFTSWATNLPVPTGGSAIPHVYLEDLGLRQVSTPSATFVNGADRTLRGFSWPDFSPDGRYLIFRSITNPMDPSKRGRYVFVWDLINHVSALTSADGSPVGWSDACVSGVNNGTSFSPKIGDASATHGYRVLFTVSGPQQSACQLIFRELEGRDVQVKPQQVGQEILEPALNDTGDVLAWAVAGATQLVYACDVAHCAT
jgi:Tol biopolymer transport system component